MYKKMYKEEGSKKFILHLVHSFLPHRIGKVISWDGVNKKCCICKEKVYSLDEIIQELGDIPQNNLDTLFDELKSKNQGKYKLAISSDNSDCIFCFSCYTDFKKFFELELLEGNKQFHAILNKSKGKQIQKKEKIVKPKTKKDKNEKKKNQLLKNKGFQALKDFKIE